MENILYYTKPAKCFEEALPLGNGRMGAMVFGNMKKEKIILNEDTLWSGYPEKKLDTKDAYKHLPALREAVFNSDHKRAKEIANRDFHGHWDESYLPFGNLIIEYTSKISAKNYKRMLDISRGIATVSSNGIEEMVFVSHPHQLIIINLKAAHPFSCNITFESQLENRVYTEQNRLMISGSAPEICQPPYHTMGKPVVYGNRAMKFTGAAVVLGDAVFEKDRIAVQNQTEITIFVSLATSYVDHMTAPTADSCARAVSAFKNIKNLTDMLTEHKRDFAALFDRVDFKLDGENDAPTDKRLKAFKRGKKDNALIALLFNYGRYLAISSSRKGTAASNLQGIWNEKMRAPWSSNYTININTQMNYWGLDICNLSDCFEPLTELVKKLADRGAETAKAYYNCAGICAHHNSDIWGHTNPAGHPMGDGDDESYSIWQSGLPWFLNMLYDHYEYDKSDSYRAEILPLFEKCLEFYKDFLVMHNGEPVTCPATSPENTYVDGGVSASLTYMPTMDREILRDFFYNCRRLGLDAPEIKETVPANDGRVPEWCREFSEKEREHRHVSHLYGIYPSAYERSDSIKKAAEKSLLARGFGGTGWSLGWKVCLWARLGNGDNAARLIRQQLTPKKPRGITIYNGGGSYPNLLDAHPPFQIDGNFGVMAGIAEMIKNNAMPKDWNGYIKGIKLKDGTEICGNITNGKVMP